MVRTPAPVRPRTRWRCASFMQEVARPPTGDGGRRGVAGGDNDRPGASRRSSRPGRRRTSEVDGDDGDGWLCGAIERRRGLCRELGELLETGVMGDDGQARR